MKGGSMNIEAIPVLVDAIKEYYSDSEFVELCNSFDIEIEDTEKPAYIKIVRTLISDENDEKNSSFLKSILPSLKTRCMGEISKSQWEERAYHENMASRLEDIQTDLNIEKA
jgi:hypothetical protein